MSGARKALLALAAKLHKEALAIKDEVGSPIKKDPFGKMILVAEMGALVRVMRCVQAAASGMETREGGDVKQAPSRSDDSPTAESGDAQ